jgi:Flp pilus assembly CpaE family ATPase
MSADAARKSACATLYSIGPIFQFEKQPMRMVGLTVSPMKKTLTVLLIEDSPEYAALVQQWLSNRSDLACVLHWTDSLQAGLNRLKQGNIDVIVLDLGLPDSTGAETFNSIKLQAARVPVILLTADRSEQLALQLVQAGAQDYLVKDSCGGDTLAKAIQYAVMRSASRAADSLDSAPDQATIIGVMGVKGGVGSTTIACNLAVELRRQTDQKTLLADLDLDGGMVGFLMSAESDHTVLDAAANVDCLDAAFWGGLISHCRGELDVLRSPSLAGVAEPDTDSLLRLLAALRKLYRWVVVDLARPSRFSLPLLKKVTELFLVTSTDVPALYEAKRAIDGLRKAGVQGDRLRIIVNQVSSKQEISGTELDRLFGVPVYAKFSDAGQELHDACVQERLLGKNDAFRVRMASLARKVAGLQVEKPRGRVSHIFSFTHKRSSTDPQA